MRGDYMNTELIKQAINNCFMTKKFEYPEIEEGMCAGLRTFDGEGEPCSQCKSCKLLYLNNNDYK
jgi:hypothetical protein